MVRALILAATAIAVPTAARAEAAMPWLGITFDAGSPYGARVIEVHPGTAAAAGGLQPGDEITAVGNDLIYPTTELWPLVSRYKIGARLPITFLRDGRRFRVAPRLTPRPSTDEIVYQRLIDQALPPLELVDRQGSRITAAERRRPLVWMIFDVHCDRCASAAAALSQRLDDGPGAEAGAGPLLRTVLVGAREEVDAYLTRVPVVGTVWRIDRVDPSALARAGEGGRRLLAGLDPRVDGTVLVVDHTGEVTFATSVSAGDAVHDGACAAVSRAVVDWRRAR